MGTKTRTLLLISCLLAAPAMEHEAGAARRLPWRACRPVCADFMGLCYDVCQTSFGAGLRQLCRRECKKRALRACRANQGEYCGDYP